MQSCPNFIFAQELHDFFLIYMDKTLTRNCFQRKNLVQIKKKIITAN